MARANQVVIDPSAGEYECLACDRTFNSTHSLLQHVRTAGLHIGEWCERCEWLFVSADARAAHVRDSSLHWTCTVCKADETSRDRLARHHERDHMYCMDCGVSFQEYLQHRISHHHRCGKCEREFDDENQLRMHRQIHLPRDQECYGCTSGFSSDSAILIHLESGACPSGVTEDDIDRWAYECYQKDQYTIDTDDGYSYRCPECDSEFSHVSAMLQHIESVACDAGYDGCIAKLKRYLMKKVADFEPRADYNSSYSSSYSSSHN